MRKTMMLFAAVVLSIPMYAQVTTTYRADIPFEFTVGQTTLPAGHYEIRTAAGGPVLTILGGEGSASVLSLPVQAKSAEQTTLTFNQYGDQYFLSQVSGKDSTVALPASKVEREIQQRAGQSRGKIVLAMR